MAYEADDDIEVVNLDDMLPGPMLRAPRKAKSLKNEKITPNSLILQMREFAKTWINEQTQKSIKDKVFHALDMNRDNLMYSALGLKKDSYRGLELQDRSSLLEVLKPSIDQAGKECLEQIARDLPKFADEKISEIKSAFANSYRQYLRDRLKEVAKQRADADAKVIIDMVGYDPDEIVKLIGDLIKDEPAPLVNPRITGKTWAPRGILCEAKVVVIVNLREDGTISMTELDVPDAKVFYLVQITAAWYHKTKEPKQAYIITNGSIWHPVEMLTVNSKMPNPAMVQKLIESHQVKIVPEFSFIGDHIFNQMNDIDEQLISKAIGSYVETLQSV